MPERTKAEVKERFAQAEYPIHVIGRHIAITDPMKKYATEKLQKVDRFGVHILDVSITMDVQKLVHTVDFIIDVNNTKIRVSGHSDNMYASIDQAIAHLESKLRRYTRRLHEHHGRHLSSIDMKVNVVGRSAPLDDINDQIEEENFSKIEATFRPHSIVSTETKPLKTLKREEAIMKMELSEDTFLIYRCEEDAKLKVMYRRTDGNYGIIEPEK